MITVIFTGLKACVNGASVESAMYEGGLEATRLCVDRRADLGAEDRQLLFWGSLSNQPSLLRACDRTSLLTNSNFGSLFKFAVLQ